MTPIENIKAHLAANIAECAAELKEFSEKLTANPVHAFSWADKAMRAAAQKQVFTDALNALHGGASLEVIKARAIKNAMFGARHPEISSSQASNVMSQNITIAQAELVSLLGGV